MVDVDANEEKSEAWLRGKQDRLLYEVKAQLSRGNRQRIKLLAPVACQVAAMMHWQSNTRHLVFGHPSLR